MSSPSPTSLPAVITKQVQRVSRRLFLQTFADVLVWCWAGALVLAAGWFLLQPFVLDNPSAWLRWQVAGGLVLAGTALAVGLAFYLAPSKLTAALSLDEKFGLKERVTTSLTLDQRTAASPAGQALLADATRRLDQLDVGEKFPLGLSRSAVVVPACAALFACVAFLYEPPRAPAKPDADDGKEPPANVAALEQRMKEMKKKTPTKQSAKPKSEELEKLEAKLEEIANRPRSTKEQLRERIKEMTALEDMMKQREKEMAQRNQSLKQQLKQLDKMSGGGTQEGPGKDLQKALSEANFEKAKEEIEKLARKLKNNELTQKDKEQLAKQLKDLEEKLNRLAQQKDKEEQLKQLAKEGKIDPETLKRELENLKKDSQKLKDLQNLAQKLGQCQKCLQQGDGKGAQQQLDEATAKLGEMDLTDQELKELRDELRKLGDCKDCAGECLNREYAGPNDTDQPNEGGVGAGRRPLGPEQATKSFETKTKGEFDAKGKKIFDGYAPGSNFRKKTSADLSGEIQQAQQEAPEAIEQQRIPKAARDMAKGYFRNLGGQQEKGEK